MAKEHIVLKNGRSIEARVDTKQEAEAIALELLADSPAASFEIGKLDKRVFTTLVPESREYGEEVY